jgi:hypothetical protein
VSWREETKFYRFPLMQYSEVQWKVGGAGCQDGGHA